MSGIEFNNSTSIYDGVAKSLTVTGVPEGGSITYSNNSYIDVGVYYIDANLYLDDVFQGELSAKLTIEPKTITLTIEDQLMEEMSSIPIWTYTLNGLIEGDELGLEIFSSTGYDAGTHEINATIGNENYDLNVISGLLTVSPYDWIFGDLNYDQEVSISDIALIQLYLAGLISFTEMQIEIADVNQDGVISILDVATTQLYLANLYNEWQDKPE